MWGKKKASNWKKNKKKESLNLELNDQITRNKKNIHSNKSIVQIQRS